MSLSIRKGMFEEVSTLLQLTRDCISTMRAAGIEQWDEVYPDAGVIARDLAAGTLEVLDEGAGIIACITIDRNMDPLWKDLDWDGAGDPAAVVHRLMVHPAQQGRGLAKEFMLHAETVARAMGCRSIRLDSFLQNPAAMALYSRLGYRRTGTAMMRKGPFAGFEKLL
jgi:ribosomal protein S18 acetylase RimI-like enzyme